MSESRQPVRAVLVLGMHRSGTSATAGVLSRLGVELGSDLVPTQSDNPKGYFEHASVVRLHDEIFSILGTNAFDPHSLPERWDHDPRITPLRERLENILRQTFVGVPLWGVKDPRLCRLLPFWTPVLRKLGVDAKVVLVVRDPAEVVESLRRRNGLGAEQSAMLWLAHIVASERDSREFSRTVLLYEDLLEDWETEVERIGATLAIDLFSLSAGVKDDVTRFLDHELRHHQHSVAPLTRAPQNAWLAKAYDAMIAWRHEGVLPAPVLDRAGESLALGERAAEPLAAYLRAQINDARLATRAASARAKWAEDAAATTTAERERVAADADRLAARVGEVEADMARLEAENADESARAQRLEADLARANRDAAQLQAERVELARVNTELAAERVELARVNAELAAERVELARVNTELAAERVELARVNTELAAERVELARVNTELAAAVAERDATLQSTTWKMMQPVRFLGSLLPPGARRVLRGGVRLAWWTVTLKLPRKLFGGSARTRG